MTTENKKATWQLVSSLAQINFVNGTKRSFDLASLFPEFLSLNLVQQNTIFYGVKQKLSDKVAKPKDEKLTDSEKAENMESIWKQLVSGVWATKSTSLKTKVNSAVQEATPEELKTMVKLGLITQADMDKELESREAE